MKNKFERGFNLNGKVALVTGAAAGIGESVAELFATRGARLVLLDRSEQVVAKAAELGKGHLGVVCDISSLEQIRAAVAQADAHMNRIDILINNAGVVLLESADAVSEAAWDLTMNINLKAPFFLAQAVCSIMARNSGGRIVNVASQASVIALNRHATYCASKAALVSITKVLAIEWASKGITVNAISPTVVETALGKKAWAGEAGETMKKQIPIGRFAQPEEIASAILYLVSGHTGIMTGSNLIIDGGYTAQ